MAKGFGKGVVTGVIATVSLVAAGVTYIKKAYVDPINEKEKQIEENRKKAARKRTAR
ncbi:MAG: DUF3042 family protein [Streptococcaceae bacterium]|nr:DUF3042 family protein [Streptococcaceae bacterium]